MIALLLAAANALAATRAEKQALAISAQAKKAYAGGDFESAARLFMDAYARVPEPTLVYNAARSYQRAGKLAEALPLFRLYLSIAAPGDDAGRADARRYVTAIENALQQRRAREAAERAELERRARETGEPLPVAPPPSPRPAPVTVPPHPSPTTPTGRRVVHRPGLFVRLRPSTWSRRQRAGAIVAGTGGGLVLIGLIIHAVGTDLDALDARGENNHIKSGGRTFYPGITQREVERALASHNAAAVTANVLITTGLLAGGLGAWMLLRDDTSVSLAPVVRPGTGALVLSGSF